MNKEILRATGMIAAVAITALSASAQAPRAQEVSGWVGITYSGTGQTDREGNLVYGEYPVVVSVDPGSPAARAGVAAGDTIIAFNDRDLRRYAFPIRNMIQPGKTFVIRARRGTSDRVAKLVVAERPADYPEGVEIAVKSAGPDVPSAPFVLTPGPGVRALIRTSGPRTSLVGTSMTLAGAEVRPLSTELAEVLGIKAQGLFIVNVVDATPAKESGLRDGDVLLRAANAALLTPHDLMRILESALERDVKLEVLRKRKLQTVVLKW